MAGQIVGAIGVPPGSPGRIELSHTLNDVCTFSTKVGSEFVYYARNFIAGPDPASVSYTVK